MDTLFYTYVEVTAKFMTDGQIVPLEIRFDDIPFEIEKVLATREETVLPHFGGTGIKFTVQIRGRQTYMWFANRTHSWFVERK